MRKLLLGSISLLLFAAAMVVIQISCSKSQAQINTVAGNQLNKFVYIRTGSGGIQIWVSDYDGNNASQIPVSMPAGEALSSDFGTMDVKLSPDGQKVFFMGWTVATGLKQIYSCNIDGSHVKVIVPNPDGAYMKIGGAY